MAGFQSLFRKKKYKKDFKAGLRHRIEYYLGISIAEIR